MEPFEPCHRNTSFLQPGPPNDPNSPNLLDQVLQALTDTNLSTRGQIHLPALFSESNGTDDPLDFNLRPATEVVTILTAYALIVVVSIIGNSMVCFIILRSRRLHTVTNVFITNLAVSDIFITIFNIPINVSRTVLLEWTFGMFLCRVASFLLMTSVYVSTFTMTVIALDRHRVILHPLRRRITLKIGAIINVCIWLAGLALSIPFAVFATVQKVDLLLYTTTRCRLCYPEPSQTFEQYLTLSTFLVQFVIPMVIMAFAYGQIAMVLWYREVVGQQTRNQTNSHRKSRRKSITMLIIVVVVFSICWLPLNLYHILTDFHPNNAVFRYNSTAYLTCHWLAVSSVCYNPFIYCWLNVSFRGEVLKHCSCKRKRPHHAIRDIEMDGMLGSRRPGRGQEVTPRKFRSLNIEDQRPRSHIHRTLKTV